MFSQFLLLVFGVFACSTAVIMIKASQLDPIVLSISRLFIAAVALFPLFYRSSKAFPEVTIKHILGRTWAPGIFLSLHYISWAIGARLTPAANASLIVNMTPVVMPFFLFWMTRERVNLKEIIGTILAFGGVVFLSISDFNYSKEYALGDLVCFGSMLAFAVYITFARRNKDLPTLWLYVVPVYAWSCLFCLLAVLATYLYKDLTVLPENAPLLKEVGLILALGLVPTILGHSLINNAMKYFRGQIVAITNLGQFIFAGIMGYLFLQEIPHKEFYIASFLLVTGVSIVLTNRKAS